MNRQQFLTLLSDFYTSNRRELPWRAPEEDGSFDPYHILVSEIMLQQTQVPRVIPKYKVFLKQFPTLASLARSDLSAVLRLWSGLGYNRRAKYLWQAASNIQKGFKGLFPDSKEALLTLPGVGPNTAGAILAYAFNQPGVFIETNIRSVIIHHFFANNQNVTDKEILDKLQQLVPWQKPAYGGNIASPRDFYWAMMDYGTMIKASRPNPSQLSHTYKKQSRFEGSRRQLRGRVIRQLAMGPQQYAPLQQQIRDERLESVIRELEEENLITVQGETLMLYNGRE